MADTKKATDKSASEESTKRGADIGSNAANAFSKLVGNLKLPENFGSSLKDKILFVLVGLLALRGAAGFAVDDVAGEVRNMFDRLEQLFTDGVLTGKSAYHEARSTAESIAKGGRQSILDYFNTAFNLNDDAKLTSLGQASGYLTRQIPELWNPLKKFYGFLHDQGLPNHKRDMSKLEAFRWKHQLTSRAFGFLNRFMIALVFAVFAGGGYGLQEESFWTGLLVGIGVLIAFVLFFVVLPWIARRYVQSVAIEGGDHRG